MVYGRDTYFPALVYVGLENGELIGSGGLAWHGGRCWIWVDKIDAGKANPFTLVRWAKRMLQVAERYGDRQVFAVRDPSEPNSAKLLRLIGFELEDAEGVTMLNGDKAELWTCRLSQ
jgi:hypothetical protein